MIKPRIAPRQIRQLNRVINKTSGSNLVEPNQIDKKVSYQWYLHMFDSSPLIKTQNSIISFGYVDSYAKIFLILYPPFENSTTRIAILQGND